VTALAFTKEEKVQIVTQYEEWIKKSQALVMMEYSKMSMRAIDNFRPKMREAKGEAHIVKNTLMEIAMEQTGIEQRQFLEGSTLVGFAFDDPQPFIKAIVDSMKNQDIFKIKGGYLNGQPITDVQVRALSEMPPLPVMRARLLGMLQAPATQLARTLAEPGRQIAAVLKAYSDKDAPQAEEIV
jgi:large subunit ribosomal protein L10